jgi:hypothetical protein
MSEYEDLMDDYDPEEAVGVPSEFRQRTMLGEAVIKANNIRRELVGQIDGMLADYVKYALLESSNAAAQLITMHPKNERELFELQKKAAPYASVMAWIYEQLSEGANAQQRLSQLDTRAQEQKEQRDE